MRRCDYGDIVKAGDIVWKVKNPDSTMDTPNMVYESMEKMWDEWRKENIPFVQFIAEKMNL